MYYHKLLISYDGTCYNGWQIQPNASSIQQQLQETLKKILGNESPAVIGSGRTDAGVHARGQVAHFKMEKEMTNNRLLLSLNGLLPQDIRIKQVETVSPDFHSRYSAIGKEYHYHVHLGRVMDPFQRLYCWHLLREIDFLVLQEAAQLFVGVHDFTSFANESHAGPAAQDAVRHLYRLDVCPTAGGFRLEFEGNGFLYKMVRNIVGTLIDVASLRKSLKDIPLIFEAKDRRQASQAAPSKGLFLMRVDYPKEEGIVIK
jgi:tRNA pseudouridine38-40 synthase